MPVNLPEKYAADHHVLLLLQRIAAADGALLLLDEDFADMEKHSSFCMAESKRLLRVDQAGEWTLGTVLFLTPAGRQMIGHELQPGLLSRSLERLVRRYRFWAHG